MGLPGHRNEWSWEVRGSVRRRRRRRGGSQASARTVGAVVALSSATDGDVAAVEPIKGGLMH